ncbi:MAG: hypothetical protein M4579_005589 [Chaenotheca gracillima]|nr:MAG: hypothetical protein M4579_005589 [Chaenotheca gracillima]
MAAGDRASMRGEKRKSESRDSRPSKVPRAHPKRSDILKRAAAHVRNRPANTVGPKGKDKAMPKSNLAQSKLGTARSPDKGTLKRRLEDGPLAKESKRRRTEDGTGALKKKTPVDTGFFRYLNGSVPATADTASAPKPASSRDRARVQGQGLPASGLRSKASKSLGAGKGVPHPTASYQATGGRNAQGEVDRTPESLGLQVIGDRAVRRDDRSALDGEAPLAKEVLAEPKRSESLDELQQDERAGSAGDRVDASQPKSALAFEGPSDKLTPAASEEHPNGVLAQVGEAASKRRAGDEKVEVGEHKDSSGSLDQTPASAESKGVPSPKDLRLTQGLPEEKPSHEVHQTAKSGPNSVGSSEDGRRTGLKRKPSEDNDWPEERRKRLRPVGIWNPRNSCFFNAAVQCVSRCRELRDFYLKHGIDNKSARQGDRKTTPRRSSQRPGNEASRGSVNQKDVNVSELFRELLEDLVFEPETRKVDTSVNPLDFLRPWGALYTGFDGREQQDPEEVLALLFQRLKEEQQTHEKLAARVSPEGGKVSGDEEAGQDQPSAVETALGVVNDGQYECSKCGDQKPAYEESFFLRVDIPMKNDDALGLPVMPLRADLDKIIQRLRCGKLQEGRECGKCHESDIYQTTVLKSQPPNLVVSVGRNSHQKFLKEGSKRRKGSAGKIETKLDFPIDGLDLTELYSDRESSKVSYDLFGIVEHHGQNVEGGHYTAIVKSDDDEWYKADDKSITRIQRDRVSEASPTLLFYRRSSQ